MKISANQLASHLEKTLLPCYLVSGDEPLLVQEALDDLRAAARRQQYDARDLFVQEQGFDWSELAAAGGNLSLFAERRIVELRLPTGKPGTKGSATIAEFAGEAGDDLLFLVSAPKLDRKAQSAKWVKALTEHGGLIQVWPVGPRDLPGWIGGRMRAVGLKPSREALAMLADRTEGNLLAAVQEIEKLRLLHGEGAVDVEAVETAVANSSRFDVYKLVDAAVSGDARRAVRVLEALRTEGVEPVIVMWAIVRELRMLAGLQEAIAAGTDAGTAFRQARIWQSRQALVRSCMGRHRPGSFHALLKRSRRADAAAKGQRREDPWQLATSLVLRLASPGAQAA